MARTGYQHTICWDCANACGNCPWSGYHHRPVKGWVATPTKIKLRSSGNKYGEGFDSSYIVQSCPLFKRDAVGHGMKWAAKQNTTIRRNAPKRRKP